MPIKFFNTRDKKELFNQLKSQFDFQADLDYIFFEASDNKIYLLSKDYANVNLQGLRINNQGLYFGKMELGGFRPSIEGSQLIQARKNIIQLTKSQVENWMMGEDIPFVGDNGFVIVQQDKDILGCGILKGNVLRNMVPKERRLNSVTENDEELE
jgi:NOL1/NOP2/fmu family ribosome biogenesis protein